MSDELWVADPESEHRRRALWGLLILGLAAVIVVALMVFLFGSSGGDDNSGLPNTSQIPEESTSAQTSNPSTSHSSSPQGSTSTKTTPSTSSSTTATTHCASGSTCMLDGDAGHVIDAINTFRKNNGQAVLPGTTTDAARQCSLNNGSGDCPSSYFWEPVSPQDGSMVVQKVASRGDGRAFLLNPSMKSLQVGWAYVGGQYSCTIVGVF